MPRFDDLHRTGTIGIIVILAFSTEIVGQTLVPECTKYYGGVSSCDFDHSHQCSWHLNNTGTANDQRWIHIQRGMKGPIKTDYQPRNRKSTDGGYIYLPSQVSRPAFATSQVSEQIKAMCIQVQYATHSETSLHVGLWADGNWTVIHTFKASNTSGHWETAGPVSCCFPEKPRRWIGFAGDSPSEMIALDYIEMTLSNRLCDASEEGKCFLSPASSLTDTTQTYSHPEPTTTEVPVSSKSMGVEPHNTQLLLIQELKKHQLRMLKELQFLRHLHDSQALQNLQQIENLQSIQRQLQLQSEQQLNNFLNLQTIHDENMKILQKLDQLTSAQD